MDFTLSLVIQIAIIIASLVILGYLVHLFYFSDKAEHFVKNVLAVAADPPNKAAVAAHVAPQTSAYVVLGLSAFIFLVQSGGIIQNILTNRKVSYR